MKRILKLCASLLVLFFISIPEITKTDASDLNGPSNVILITLDGVRWDEVFRGTDSRLTGKPSEVIFKNLTGELSKQGLLLGDRKTSFVNVSNPVNLSLPGYQNIFAGFHTGCRMNTCKRTRYKTFPEELVEDYGFDKMDAAGFASWSQISKAYEHGIGNTFINAGLRSAQIDDPVHAQLNQEQFQNIPKWNHPGLWTARYDQYTFAHGMHFLKTHHPRFLYISLLDADEHGHAGDYPSYIKTLSQYDQWIKELTDYLDSSGEYGKNTLLLITTDHGRGYKKHTWSGHGLPYPHSKLIWMYARGKGVTPGRAPASTDKASNTFSHNDIRPTIEKALGFEPNKGYPGRPLPGVEY